MYIVEYKFEQNRRCNSPLSCDEVTNDHCILCSFDTFTEGYSYLRMYYDGYHSGMNKEAYKEEFFDCKEYTHSPDGCEARTWKSWEYAEDENYKLVSYEELYLHAVAPYNGKGPFEDIEDYKIG